MGRAASPGANTRSAGDLQLTCSLFIVPSKLTINYSSLLNTEIVYISVHKYVVKCRPICETLKNGNQTENSPSNNAARPTSEFCRVSCQDSLSYRPELGFVEAADGPC